MIRTKEMKFILFTLKLDKFFFVILSHLIHMKGAFFVKRGELLPPPPEIISLDAFPMMRAFSGSILALLVSQDTQG